MSNRTDPNYLKNIQYRDSRNLDARINLHRRFSTNPANWYRWVLNQFGLEDTANILELGCGSAKLWQQNLDRIPSGWNIHLSDFSPGMVREARVSTSACPQMFSFSALDAQAIPFPAASLDLVVANHMLYHIPDRHQAFGEIYRVLKYGGILVAATNGIHHMKEIRQLLARLNPALLDHTYHAFGVSEFTIENGMAQLSPFFSNIRTVPFIDGLEVTEAEPLIDYILSMNAAPEFQLTKNSILTLQQLIAAEISIRGSIHIQKSTALFIAEKSHLPKP